jgi:hypothetical protein
LRTPPISRPTTPASVVASAVATHRAHPPLRAEGPKLPPKPLVETMRLGKAPDDGDCFFHSLIQVARPALSAQLKVPPHALTPKHLRDHMASHLIDQFLQSKKLNADLEKLLQREPYLIALMSCNEVPPVKTLELSTAKGQEDFVEAVGLHNAIRCADLTAEQKAHVYNVAKTRSWNTSTSDVMALLAPAAFKDMKLTVLTADTTAANKDSYTKGEGQAYYLFLDTRNKHYVPAFE